MQAFGEDSKVLDICRQDKKISIQLITFPSQNGKIIVIAFDWMLCHKMCGFQPILTFIRIKVVSRSDYYAVYIRVGLGNKILNTAL